MHYKLVSKNLQEETKQEQIKYYLPKQALRKTRRRSNQLEKKHLWNKTSIENTKKTLLEN